MEGLRLRRNHSAGVERRGAPEGRHPLGHSPDARAQLSRGSRRAPWTLFERSGRSSCSRRSPSGPEDRRGNRRGGLGSGGEEIISVKGQARCAVRHPQRYRASHARGRKGSRRRSPERRDRWRCAVHRRRTSQSSGVGGRACRSADLPLRESGRGVGRPIPKQAFNSIARSPGWAARTSSSTADRRALGRCSQAIW